MMLTGKNYLESGNALNTKLADVTLAKLFFVFIQTFYYFVYKFHIFMFGIL